MAGASFVGGVGYLYVFISEFCDSKEELKVPK